MIEHLRGLALDAGFVVDPAAELARRCPADHIVGIATLTSWDLRHTTPWDAAGDGVYLWRLDHIALTSRPVPCVSPSRRRDYTPDGLWHPPRDVGVLALDLVVHRTPRPTEAHAPRPLHEVNRER
jgi:hypothetical protein